MCKLNKRLCISQFHLRPPPRADPREISIFFALDGKSPGVGTKKEGKCTVLGGELGAGGID